MVSVKEEARASHSRMKRVVAGAVFVTIAIATACLLWSGGEVRQPMRAVKVKDAAPLISDESSDPERERLLERGRQLSRLLELRLPLPGGVVALCTQGNESPEGYTHWFVHNRYSLDFAVRGEARVKVVAAASGEVIRVVDFEVESLEAGGGYGRQVVLRHEGGLTTRYAHLADVLAQVGERLEAGDELGLMGRSGHAYERHLHFSLQMPRPAASADDWTSSVEIPMFRLAVAFWGTAEKPQGSPELRVLPSSALLASPEMPWLGGLYSPDEEVGEDQFQRLRSSLLRRLEMERLIAQLPTMSADQVRAYLAPHMAVEDADPVVLYYQAIGVFMKEGQWQVALETLAKAERFAAQPRWFEQWLPAWIHAQRAVAQTNQARVSNSLALQADRLRRDFKAAEKEFPSEHMRRFVAHHLEELEGL